MSYDLVVREDVSLTWPVFLILARVSRLSAKPGDILARFGKKRRSKKTEGENSCVYRLSKANSLSQ